MSQTTQIQMVRTPPPQAVTIKPTQFQKYSKKSCCRGCCCTAQDRCCVIVCKIIIWLIIFLLVLLGTFIGVNFLYVCKSFPTQEYLLSLEPKTGTTKIDVFFDSMVFTKFEMLAEDTFDDDVSVYASVTQDSDFSICTQTAASTGLLEIDSRILDALNVDDPDKSGINNTTGNTYYFVRSQLSNLSFLNKVSTFLFHLCWKNSDMTLQIKDGVTLGKVFAVPTFGDVNIAGNIFVDDLEIGSSTFDYVNGAVSLEGATVSSSLSIYAIGDVDVSTLYCSSDTDIDIDCRGRANISIDDTTVCNSIIIEGLGGSKLELSYSQHKGHILKDIVLSQIDFSLGSLTESDISAFVDSDDLCLSNTLSDCSDSSKFIRFDGSSQKTLYLLD
ncbi:hypothetical protein ADUPG1_013636 [Aduncisulcus paluster]|uniref:Adhesin domain-containing protein n=1 Tax=Aduncisulcus paluster TaxID=2918883 RepID=A0ABQ5K3L6_9EUKA|nr:hypothetical protein ADUPG1_013636 [Aduncisulcus paluster]|eukprot:gnl/Carplike_NY0171/887_a1218_1863.p1 GENE.gnl/Carplike_NY0171/887_a1218_1863~~gnl/Carplike_NY0171/887_a1218_1863.p1  ORF type:complete len:410 (+),score=45.29 gnl/Carplike_NY0171/887_a1218_1863:75-1232(+)